MDEKLPELERRVSHSFVIKIISRKKLLNVLAHKRISTASWLTLSIDQAIIRLIFQLIINWIVSLETLTTGTTKVSRIGWFVLSQSSISRKY